MKWPETLIILGCLLSQYLVQSVQVFDVLKYGAKTDGTHKNTAEIAKAIEAASAAGAGTVHFPKGTYLTGPIHLQSNVTLNLDDGVLIKFSDDFDDYLPMVEVRWEGTVMMNLSPLIYGINVSHVAITGHGNATLDGSGEKWWKFFHHLWDDKNVKNESKWDTTWKWQTEFFKQNAVLLKNIKEHVDQPQHLTYGFQRPQFFHTMYSDHITLEGVTFVNSPWWNLNPSFSDYVKIDNVKVLSPVWDIAPNTDGVDLDSVRFATVSNSYFSVGDDCICIKSGRDKEGRIMNRPSENITVTDCVTGTGPGGITIGSEMSGSVRNVYFSNITMNGTDRGILIKSGRGRGGLVENIHITDVHMTNLIYEGIFIHALFYDGPKVVEPVSERTPHFRNILIENVWGDSHRRGIHILGLPEKPFDNIELRNVHITAKEDIEIKDATRVRLINVTLND